MPSEPETSAPGEHGSAPIIPPELAHTAPKIHPHTTIQAPSGSTFGSLISTLIFLIVVGGLSYGGYVFFEANQIKNPKTVSLSTPMPDLLSFDDTITIDATDASAVKLAGIFLNKVRAGTKAGQTLGIIPAIVSETETRPFTADEFFSRAQIKAPGIFVRALEPQFSAGVYGSGSGFFVFKTTDYGRALAGLLAWEQTMPVDLKPFLGTDLSYDAIFKDKTIGGTDARVAGSGESALVYGIVQNRFIVIAHGEGAFATIIGLVGK